MSVISTTCKQELLAVTDLSARCQNLLDPLHRSTIPKVGAPLHYHSSKSTYRKMTFVVVFVIFIVFVVCRIPHFWLGVIAGRGVIPDIFVRGATSIWNVSKGRTYCLIGMRKDIFFSWFVVDVWWLVGNLRIRRVQSWCFQKDMGVDSLCSIDDCRFKSERGEGGHHNLSTHSLPLQDPSWIFNLENLP